MIFIAIVGTPDQIAPLYGMPGLDVQGRREELGGGRRRVVAMVTRRSVIDEIRARGLTVEITKSEEETQRAIQRDYEMMRPAHEAEEAAKEAAKRGRGSGGSGGGSAPK